MKKLLLFPFWAMLSTTGFAATVHVLIPNYDSYGRGMICVVDAQYDGQFSNLIHASDFSDSRTDKKSALKLMGFFRDVDKDACYVPQGSKQQLDVPNASTVYVVTILMKVSNGAATDVYWDIADLNAGGSLPGDQNVTVDAPKL